MSTVIKCPRCGFGLSQVLVIESMDEELAENSGMYCPVCFAEEMLIRCKDFEQINKQYQGLRRMTGGLDSALAA